MRVRWTVCLCLVVLVLSLGSFLLAAPEPIRVPAETFSSNGDSIHGWYWLRDPSYYHVAEWVFQGVPLGEEDLLLEMEVLATDRMDGPSGVDARFFLSYGLPPWGDRGGLIVGTQEVFLPNVSRPDDPTGYVCRGVVSISREHMDHSTMIWVRAHRSLVPGHEPEPGDGHGGVPSAVHVAFRKESALLAIAPDSIDPEPPVDEEMPFSTRGDFRWNAIPVGTGLLTGFLWVERSDGTMNSEDWYRFPVTQGQLITLTLSYPTNAQFSLTLFPPESPSSVGTTATSDSTRTLSYVAGMTGDWFIRVSRTSGEGEYALTIELQDQDDAGSGGDAGDFRWDALPISQGTISGFLKVADSEDWYRFPVTQGQLITLTLSYPTNAQFSLTLFPPESPSSVGTTATSDSTRTLSYVAGMTGDWFIRVSRTSGEGEYALTIEFSLVEEQERRRE